MGINGTGVKMAGRSEAPGYWCWSTTKGEMGLWVEALDEQDPEALMIRALS